MEGEAVGLVKHFSLSEDNYAIALKRLKDRYSNPDVVKHILLQSIISFKCESGPKFVKSQSALTAFANALDELRTVHNLPRGELLCNELLREICFYNLPLDLRKGLIKKLIVITPQLMIFQLNQIKLLLN